MHAITKLIIGIYASGFLLALALIIILIIRRIKKKEKENFEKRDN